MNLIEVYKTKTEGKHFDRKSAKIKPKDIIRHVIAFANAEGGTLVIGIEDNGKVTGFQQKGAQKIDDYEEAIYSLTHPNPSFQIKKLPVMNESDEADTILVIEIDSSHDRIIRRKDDAAVFLRMSDSSKQLTYEQIANLEYDKGERYFEDREIRDATLEDIDEELMSRFKELNQTNQSTKQVLEARGLVKNGYLTNAAILLFGKNTFKFLPQARLRFLRYDGNRAETGERFNVVKEFDYEGPIPLLIERMAKDIRSQLRDFQYLDTDGKFKVVPEYPEFAWFEGIVNALTHRNYSLRGNYVRISMYDDRFEILSPGSLPNIVTLENMKVERYARNPRVSRTLTDFGWVKELNEGVARIYEEMKEFYLKEPTYSEPNETSVRLVLENSIASRRIRTVERAESYLEQMDIEGFSSDEKEIISYLYGNENINISIAAKLLGKSRPYTRKLLKNLEEKGALIWHGSNRKDPTQHYTLKK